MNTKGTTDYLDRFFRNRGSVRFRTVVEKRAVWEDPQKYLRILKLKFNKDHGSAIQHDPIIRHATVANLKSRDFDQFQNNMHWCKMWYLGQLSRWDPTLWLIWKLGASSRQKTDKNRPTRTGEGAHFGRWKLAKLPTTKTVCVEIGGCVRFRTIAKKRALWGVPPKFYGV